MKEEWNYKGLVCQIDHTETGCIYSVFDIGLITREPHLFLYGGSKVEFTRESIQEKVDIKLNEDKIQPTNQCQHLVRAYRQGHCAFANHNCDESGCPCYSNGGTLYSDCAFEDKLEDAKDSWYEELKDGWCDDLEELLEEHTNLDEDEIESIMEDMRW